MWCGRTVPTDSTVDQMDTQTCGEKMNTNAFTVRLREKSEVVQLKF